MVANSTTDRALTWAICSEFADPIPTHCVDLLAAHACTILRFEFKFNLLEYFGYDGDKTPRAPNKLSSNKLQLLHYLLSLTKAKNKAFPKID